MLRKLFLVLGWNLGLLAVALILVELAFGGWLNAVNAPNLWRLSIYRNVDWRLDTSALFASSGSSRYVRDHWGLRGAFGDPDNVDILAVGGSTTDERFIDEDKTWTRVLQTCFATSGRPQRIANAGVGGQSTRGHIRNFHVWFNNIPGLRPKRILAYIGVNENFLSGRQSEDDVLSYNESRNALWWERAKLNSALYGFTRILAGNWVALRKGYHHVKFSGDGLASEQVDKKWRALSTNQITRLSDDHAATLATVSRQKVIELTAYRQRLLTLVEEIQKFKAEPVLVTQTNASWRIRDDIVRGDLNAYFDLQAINEITLAVCREQGLFCIDLGGSISIEDGDFYDSVHATPQGSQRVGELICRAITAENK